MFAPPHIHPRFERCLMALSQQFGVWIVGGWVRDSLVGLPPKDVDFATNAPPAAIVAAALKSGLTIIHDEVAHAHGIYCLHAPGSQENLDLACLRTDERRIGQRHAEVAFTSHIETDLARRDLTINAMAMPYPFVAAESPEVPTIIDPFGGRAHLRDCKLQLVGVPMQRLDEDPLRLLRVARFACLGEGWAIDEATCQALREAAPKLARISFERIRQEILRAMQMPCPARFWQLVAHARAHTYLLPRGLPSTQLHLAQAVQWLKHGAERAPAQGARLVMFFAGLLADADEDARAHHQAQHHGAFVEACLRQWRCPNDMIAALAQAVAQLPWRPESLKGTALAQWVIAVGAQGYELIDPLLDLGAIVWSSEPLRWHQLRARVHAMVGPGPWPSMANLAITGAEVMALRNLKPGPHIGALLRELLVWATAHGCVQDATALRAHVISSG